MATLPDILDEWKNKIVFLQIGPLSLTVQEITTGILASLIVFPINLFIVYIFRNSRHRESKSLREAKKKSKAYEAEKASKEDKSGKPAPKKKKEA